MRLKFFSLILIAFVGLIDFCEAKPQKAPKDKRAAQRHDANLVQMLHQSLELKGDQIQKINNLKQKQENRIQKLNERKAKLLERMQKLQNQDNVNEKELIQLGEKLGGIKVRYNLAKQGYFKELIQLLSPEQRKKFHQIRQKQKQRLKGRFRRNQ